MTDLILGGGSFVWLIIVAFAILFPLTVIMIFFKKKLPIIIIFFIISFIPLFLGFTGAYISANSADNVIFHEDRTQEILMDAAQKTNAPVRLGFYATFSLLLLNSIDLMIFRLRKKSLK